MRKTLIAGVLLGALAVPAVSQAQNVRVVNHAGLSGSKVSHFKAATSSILNGMFRAQYRTAPISWGGGGWTIEFVNSLGPVNRFCGQGAAGCHGVRHGRPYAIVDTNFAEVGRVWSAAGTHEMEEMWADPYIKTVAKMPNSSYWWAVEVSDPVEDWTTTSHGVKVSDYVLPAWFNNVATRQDAFGWLKYYGANHYGFSCPTGFAQYYNGSRWVEFGPGAEGGGCMLKGSLLTASVKPFTSTPAPSPRMKLNGQRERVSILPIKK